MKLLNYQKEGCYRGVELLSKNQPCLLADEMGLGKSIQALNIMHHFVEKESVCGIVGDKIILIVCPSFLVDNWEEEIIKSEIFQSTFFYVRKINNTKFSLSEARKESPNQGLICIVGYSAFCSEKIFTSFSCRDIFMTIVDECHYLKNPKSQRTQSIFGKKK